MRTNAPARSQTPAARKPGGIRTWLYAACVGVITVFVFAPVFGNGFVNYDDDRAILHNPYIAEHAPGRLAWMWSTFHLGHYQPLAWMSLALDHALAGTNAAAFHADSLLWHAAAGAMLFVLLAELLCEAVGVRFGQEDGRRLAAAAAGAHFWSIHPLRVESVAWATERRDPISAVFLLLAAVAYVRSARGGGRRRTWYVASLACVLASLLAKAWGMTFFAVLAVLDVYPLRRLPMARTAFTDVRYRRVWLEKLPFALLGAGAAALSWLAQRAQPDAMLSLAEWGPGSRILQSAYGLWFYPAKTVWPTALAIVYPLPAGGRPAPAVWGVWLVLAAGAAAAIATVSRRWPAVAACAATYAVVVAPVLGVAQSGPQLVADRYSYVSAVAFSALLCGALARLDDHSWRWARTSAVAVLAVLAALTWRQTTVWHDSATLWRHAIESGHESYIAHLDYGQALRSEGDLAGAIAEYRRALQMRPDAGPAWYNLANALKASGNNADAEAAYKRAIDYLPRKVEAQVNLGNLYYVQRRLGEAIEQYRAAVSAVAGAPAEQVAPEPYLFLGMALADHGEIDAAREPLLVALRYPQTRARAEQELRRLAAIHPPASRP